MLKITPVLLRFSLVGSLLLYGQYGVSWLFLFWYISHAFGFVMPCCAIFYMLQLSNYSSHCCSSHCLWLAWLHFPTFWLGDSGHKMIFYVQIKPPGMQERNNTDIDEELLTQKWDVGSRAYRLKFWLPFWFWPFWC